MHDEKELFQLALDRSPADRPAFLLRACPDDAALRRRVEILVHAHENPGSFLAGPASELQAAGAAAGPESGDRIGPYTLVERIADGGMGSVFRAEQAEPVRREVAVKVVRAGCETPDSLARFEAERQALARMDHPNIAKVLDAGATAAGRPYYVMELVAGIPIGRFCDEHRLTIRARLELFVAVCHAVQHAHQKGIIHRDLKPSNVLVACFDGRPVPKVIDFGIAKATAPETDEVAEVTRLGTLIGTPQYMSPEQAALGREVVDTRTDIYSLGVLLYELLTGSTPLRRQPSGDAALLDVLSAVREVDPDRPSARVLASGDPGQLAAARGTDAGRLVRALRGDLDWIVMRAIEKRPDRRYETPNLLAADLVHFLRDEPVLAGPPSPRYRLRKFVQRNRRAVWAAGVAALAGLIALSAVAGSAGWLMRDREQRRIEAASRTRAAYERAAGLRREGRRVEAQAALESVALVRRDAAPDPELAAAITALADELEAEARDERFVGRYEDIRSRVLDSTVVDASRFDYGPRFSEVVAALGEFGIEPGVTDAATAAACVRGRPDGPRAALVSALDDCVEYLPAQHRASRPWLLDVLLRTDADPWRTAVRRALRFSAEAQELVQLAERADVAAQPAAFLTRLANWMITPAREPGVAFLRRIVAFHAGDVMANHGLALALAMSGEPGEAVRYYTAAVALRPDNAAILLNRSVALRQSGEPAAALADARRAAALDPKLAAPCVSAARTLKVLGDLPGAIEEYRRAAALAPDSAAVARELGHALRQTGRLDEAVPQLQRSLALEPDHARTHFELGIVFELRKEWDNAIESLRKAVGLDQTLALAHHNLGILQRRKGALEDAERSFERAVAADGDRAVSHDELGVTRFYRGDVDGAITAHRAALAIDPKMALAEFHLGNALLKKRDVEAAVAAYRRSIALDPKSAGAHSNLGAVLERRGELRDAVAAYREAIAADPEEVKAHVNLAGVLMRLRDHDGALSEYRAVLALRPTFAIAHARVGRLLWMRGEVPAAVAAYRQALAGGADPLPKAFVAVVERELAWMLVVDEAVGRDDLQWADAVARRFASEADGDPIAAMLLGLVELRQRRFAASVQALGRVRATRGRPRGLPQAAFVLAMARFHLGETAAAQALLADAERWMDENAKDNPELCRLRTEAARLIRGRDAR